MGTIRQIMLARRPTGQPVADDFALAEAPMPVPGPGQFLVRMKVGSVDPAIRGFLDDRPSYLPPVAIGAPIAGMSLGEVVESHDSDWPVGTLLHDPIDPAILQALQSPVHDELQQTPSVQLPLRHSPPIVHVTPFENKAQLPAPLHVAAPAHSFAGS